MLAPQSFGCEKNPILTISKGSSFPAENRQQFRYLLNEVVCSTNSHVGFGRDTRLRLVCRNDHVVRPGP